MKTTFGSRPACFRRTKLYGCIEFVVEDPNGFRLVFSEEPLPS
jgi:hypothetical protein